MSDYSSDDYDNDEPEYIPPVSLQECGKCGRKFNEEALTRHSKICSKVNKPRKVFDSKKQRMENLENEAIKIKQPEPKKAPKKKKDWRRTHEEFIKTIRAARGVTTAQRNGSELPPPPSPTFNPDYIQCPHCDRRFNENAAERHINFCKEQKSRIPKQSSDSKYSVKKAKQQIRTQYRPPVPGQKKKSVDSPSNRGTHANSPGSKNDNSPAGMKKYGMQLERNTKSDSVLVTGKRKTERAPRAEPNEERPTNSRYSKTTSRISSAGSASDNEKPRSGKNRNGDPIWFEDLKRHDSGNARKQRHVADIDEQDSGLDLNSNFSSHRSKGGRNHPVGVVRPSSRSKETGILEDEMDERKVSAGRRKMANFCHDCGTKYPVTNAKFCCECGVRRMALS